MELWGRFELGAEVGRGGMGVVHRAVDRETGTPVAIKLLTHLDPGSRARFEREVELLTRLTHPGITRFIAAGVTPAGQRFLAMEWLEGVTLREHLARVRCSIADTLALGRGIAAALGFAHRLGVVHRDVKPANVFLLGGRADQPRLMDFGVARGLGAAELTSTGVRVGTPAYMAPEQVRGDRGIDARSDVFSLGVLLYQCLTRRRPFSARTPTAALEKILHHAPTPVRVLRFDAPEALAGLVERMLAKDPALRPEDGLAVREALDAIAADPGEAASSPIVALGRHERRVRCFVIATAPAAARGRLEAIALGHADPDEPADTAPEPSDPTVVVPSPGTVQLEFELTHRGAPSDAATRAAHAALAMRAAVPEAALAIVVGPDDAATPSATRTTSTPGRVELDPSVARLLEERFAVEHGPDGAFLGGPRLDPAATRRTLLGQPTPCAGREAELSALLAAYEASVDEPQAKTVLVTAPAGAGKSRLVAELMARLGGERFELFVARGDPLSAGAPFGLLGSAIRRAAGVLDGEGLELSRQKLLARIAAAGVEVGASRTLGAFLGEIAGIPFDEAESVELLAARRDAQLLADQTRRAFVDWLAAETTRGPVLLLLEDVHWGDLPSVRLVDAALAALGDRPLFVLALARPEVEDAFPRLWAGHDVQHLRLGPLPRRAARELVRLALGRVVPDVDVDRIVARAAGNAFYLEELVRAAAAGAADDLPPTVLAMVQARLERMEEGARRVLRSASVFGQVFWLEGVAELLGGDAASRLDAEAWLRRLSERETIERRARSRLLDQGEWSFRHALVGEAAYAMLTDADRILGHRLAAAWLERAGEPEALVLAEHYDRGRSPADAARWYRAAALTALDGNDFERALAHARRALELGAPAGPTLRLIAEAHAWRGEFALARAAGEEALARLPAGGEEWLLTVVELALAAGVTGGGDLLVELAERLVLSSASPAEAGTSSDVRGGRARVSSPSPPAVPETSSDVGVGRARVSSPSPAEGRAGMSLPSPAEGRAEVSSPSIPAVLAATRLAEQLIINGRVERALPLFTLLARVPEAVRSADPGLDGRLHQAEAMRACFLGRVDEHLEHADRAAERLDLAGDRRNACARRERAGYARMDVGAYAEAETVLRAALGDAERLGLANVAATAKHNLGLTLARLGRAAEGAELEASAATAFAGSGNRRMEGAAREYLALIHLSAGDADAAEREARQAIALAERPTLLPLNRAESLAILAQALLAQGRAEEALAAAEAAHVDLEGLGGIDDGEALIRLTLAEARLAVGDVDRAREALRIARARLLARAARIEGAWRDTFLSAVPENARTLELARRYAE